MATYQNTSRVDLTLHSDHTESQRADALRAIEAAAAVAEVEWCVALLSDIDPDGTWTEYDPATMAGAWDLRIHARDLVTQGYVDDILPLPLSLALLRGES